MRMPLLKKGRQLAAASRATCLQSPNELFNEALDPAVTHSWCRLTSDPFNSKKNQSSCIWPIQLVIMMSAQLFQTCGVSSQSQRHDSEYSPAGSSGTFSLSTIVN